MSDCPGQEDEADCDRYTCPGKVSCCRMEPSLDRGVVGSKVRRGREGGGGGEAGAKLGMRLRIAWASGCA